MSEKEEATVPSPPPSDLVVSLSQPSPIDGAASVPSEAVVEEKQLGVGPKRKETHGLSLQWLEVWLSNNRGTELTCWNRSYPNSLVKLEEKYIKGPHIRPFLGTFGSWFAMNRLTKLNGKGILEPSSKEAYFKAVKDGLKKKFPNHTWLNEETPNWWYNLPHRFKRNAKVASQKDPHQFKEAKSSSLYRDTTSNTTSIDDQHLLNHPDAMYRAQARRKCYFMRS